MGICNPREALQLLDVDLRSIEGAIIGSIFSSMIMCPSFFALLVTALLLVVPTISHADGVLVAWSPDAVEELTRADFELAKGWTVAEILQKNREVTSWRDAFLVVSSSGRFRDDSTFLRGLVAQLADRHETKLTGTRRLIIWERIISGDIFFEGKGYQVDDDIFTLAGRANWILRQAATKNFGIVRPFTTDVELKELHKKWESFLAGKEVEEYHSPWQPMNGIVEISSPYALEALIISLKPSRYKDSLTHSCLRRLYGLDTLPSNRSLPPSYCSPDTYTYGYLKVLTGITEERGYAQWMEWWEEKHANLRFDPPSGTFVEQ
jgi:hypothetical protein